MARRFLMKHIAEQSGLSLATVDRVLHGRAGVRRHTRLRVEQAIAELEAQEHQLGRQGRKFLFDLVMEVPARFSRLVDIALARVVPGLPVGVVRLRRHVKQTWNDGEFARCLDALAHKGSHGVLLKAPRSTEVEAAVARLGEAGIPVVTMTTDLDPQLREGYVGMDNRRAGETAAYLMQGWSQAQSLEVLVSLSSARFEGEVTRVEGFCAALADARPDVRIHRIDQGQGLDLTTTALTRECLRQHPQINAVYSVGGANRAILRAFAEAGREARVYIGHDLDDDNTALLRQRALTAVIHHDLDFDMQHALLQLLARQGVVPQPPPTPLGIQIVTPCNLP